jgi:hypothetical protein
MLRAAFDNPRAADGTRCRTSWRSKSVARSKTADRTTSGSRAFQGVYAVTLTYGRRGGGAGSTMRSRTGLKNWSKSRSRKDEA